VPSCHRAIVPSCHRANVPSCHRAIVPTCHCAIVPSCQRAIVPSCHRAIEPLVDCEPLCDCLCVIVLLCCGANVHGRWRRPQMRAYLPHLAQDDSILNKRLRQVLACLFHLGSDFGAGGFRHEPRSTRHLWVGSCTGARRNSFRPFLRTAAPTSKPAFVPYAAVALASLVWFLGLPFLLPHCLDPPGALALSDHFAWCSRVVRSFRPGALALWDHFGPIRRLSSAFTFQLRTSVALEPVRRLPLWVVGDT
jgi:hypothetical protein